MAIYQFGVHRTDRIHVASAEDLANKLVVCQMTVSDNRNSQTHEKSKGSDVLMVFIQVLDIKTSDRVELGDDASVA